MIAEYRAKRTETVDDNEVVRPPIRLTPVRSDCVRRGHRWNPAMAVPVSDHALARAVGDLGEQLLYEPLLLQAAGNETVRNNVEVSNAKRRGLSRKRRRCSEQTHLRSVEPLQADNLVGPIGNDPDWN